MASSQSHDLIQSFPPNSVSSQVHILKPYVFQQTIQQCIGRTESDGHMVRLQTIAYIDGIRKALQMPVHTYNTAVVYYLKYHLTYPSDTRFIDAAATAVFVAGKIEDTLKQSADVLAAAYCLRLPPTEQLIPYDTRFETHPKVIVGFERLMLEASRFDFRNRHPQMLVLKLAKHHRVQKDTIGKTAFNMSLDAYRTFAPLKQTRATLAVACVELSARIFRQNITELEAGNGYNELGITRAEVIETLLDLLDLYTEYRSATIVGRDHNLNTFLGIRIVLNLEASANQYPRYAQSMMEKASANSKEHLTAYDTRERCESGQKLVVNPREHASPKIRDLESAASAKNLTRFQQGTIRFVLDPERAKNEKRAMASFFGFIKEDKSEVEAKRSAKRGVEQGFERDREQMEGLAGEREGERRRDFAGSNSPYFCSRDNLNQEMGLKVDLQQKMAENLAGPQASDVRRGRGQGRGEYDRWENLVEEDFKKVEYGCQDSEEGQQSGQRKPLLDQKQAYYIDQGIPPPEVQKQIANTRKRFLMNMAETQAQAPSSFKEGRLLASKQTQRSPEPEQVEARRIEAGKTQPRQKSPTGELSKKKDEQWIPVFDN